MDQSNASEIKEKIVGGIVALSSRTFILQFISFLATFILTVLLTPEVFGVFFLVTAFISFLSYFSDIGLAAALIQKEKKPTEADLITVFTIQQIMVGFSVIVAFLTSKRIGSFYKLDNNGVFLLQALIISFFLSSLKTIPSILLERKLEFALLVIPQLLETITFYLITIILAFFGYGIASFAFGALARGFVGVISIYIISPWKISFGISFKTARQLLSFGIPFQTNSLLALVKDDLMTVFLGKILPFSHIGYIGWAKKWAEIPLRLIMDSVIRVTFPAFSRLQKDRILLKKALEKSIFFLGICILPVTVVLIIVIKPLVNILPKYSKWEPALVSFYFFSLSSMFSAFSSPMVNALNAIGRIKTTLKLMVFWTLTTWILIPLLVSYIGFNGVAVSILIISLTGIIPIILMKKYVSYDVGRPLLKPVVTAIIIGITTYFLFRQVTELTMFILFLISIFIGYLIIITLWMKSEISPYLGKFIKKIKI